MLDVENFVSIRILLGSWLLFTLVFGIYLTSFMRSKLSDISYETIDSVTDLLNHKTMIPVMVRNLADYIILQREVTKSSKLISYYGRIYTLML